MSIRELQRRVALLENVRQNRSPPSSLAARILVAVAGYLDEREKRALREIIVAKVNRRGNFTDEELASLCALVEVARKRATAERDRE